MGSRRRGLREQVLRAARADPTATARTIAHRVGCHPSTAARHLKDQQRDPRLGTSTLVPAADTEWPCPDSDTEADYPYQVSFVCGCVGRYSRPIDGFVASQNHYEQCAEYRRIRNRFRPRNRRRP